jgi:N-acetylneuraminate lyase
MTTAERMAVAEEWVKVAGPLKVVVNVSHNCLQDCRDLAAHAQKIGAHSVSMTATTYFKPKNVAELVAMCGEVAKASPDLPFYYYHIPIVTGVAISMPEFLALGRKSIPNLVGLKYSDSDLVIFAELLESGLEVLYGRDEMTLPAYSMGCRASVGSTFNYMPQLYLEVIRLFRENRLEEARKVQLRANSIIAVMADHGGLPANKAIMGLLGLDCGPVRLPLSELPPERQASLYAGLRGLSFPGS